MSEPMRVEQWREVPGLPGYLASSEGRIASTLKGSPRVLRQVTDGSGYFRVNIRGFGRRSMALVHRMVLAAFDRERPGPEIVGRHLDGSRTNNRPENLKWGTASENTLDAVRHGTHPTASRTHCRRGHPYDEVNTRRTASGRRECRICQYRRAAEYRQRLRDAR